MVPLKMLTTLVSLKGGRIFSSNRRLLNLVRELGRNIQEEEEYAFHNAAVILIFHSRQNSNLD